MARFRKRKQLSRKNNLIGAAIILSVLVVISSLFIFRYQLQQQQVLFDPETLCPLSEPSPKYVALIFDKSDEYNAVQQRFLKRFFTEFKSQLLAGTKISIYVIDEQNNKNFSPYLTVCAPRTGIDANAFYENPRLIRQRWQQQFEKPLDDVINGFMQASKADFSPIMEAFQIVSLSAFPAVKTTVDKQIIVISDMLHHMPEWSHYRGQMDFSLLQKTSYYQRINTDLQNADVKILYVRRDGMEKLQNKRHAFFWADYIQSIGGRVSLIEKIDG